MLNYGYALLEAECLKVINTVGLDPCIGFLHEMRNEKRSLAYDLQEIFRGEVDVIVIDYFQRVLESLKMIF